MYILGFCYSHISTDPSITDSSLTSALLSLPDTQWKVFGKLMNVPESTLNKVESDFDTDGKRKSAVFTVYSREHPQPTWDHVSDALYQMRAHDVLDALESFFPTGKSTLKACIHTISPLFHLLFAVHIPPLQIVIHVNMLYRYPCTQALLLLQWEEKEPGTYRLRACSSSIIYMIHTDVTFQEL